MLQLHKVLLALWIYPKPIKTNNADIHLLWAESQSHAAVQLSAVHNPWLTFGVEEQILPLLMSRCTLLCAMYFTGCQKAFLGPHFGKQWCNNLNPWRHLTKQTHWNRNVNILGNHVSKGSLTRTWQLSLFFSCSKRFGEQIATSIGPRRDQEAGTEAYH